MDILMIMVSSECVICPAGVMNDAYTSGINCPYEIPDQWKYLFIADWYVDPTLRFTCTKTRQQWEEEQSRL